MSFFEIARGRSRIRASTEDGGMLRGTCLSVSQRGGGRFLSVGFWWDSHARTRESVKHLCRLLTPSPFRWCCLLFSSFLVKMHSSHLDGAALLRPYGWLCLPPLPLRGQLPSPLRALGRAPSSLPYFGWCCCIHRPLCVVLLAHLHRLVPKHHHGLKNYRSNCFRIPVVAKLPK